MNKKGNFDTTKWHAVLASFFDTHNGIFQGVLPALFYLATNFYHHLLSGPDIA